MQKSESTPAKSWPNWRKPRMKASQSKRTARYVSLFYVLLFVAWQVLFSAGVIPEYLFPSPVQVAKRLWELGEDGYLWPNIQATLLRMIAGFAIAGGIGLTIGLMMGMSNI